MQNEKHTMCGRMGLLSVEHGEIRTNVEHDRLSNLPDDLIHIILSFISVSQAIKTSVLSCRWRCIWTSMPNLNFSNDDFFPNFVSNVLSHRNDQIQVSSIKLIPRGPVSPKSVKRILNYAFSHNVQELNVNNIAKNIVRSSLSVKRTPDRNIPALTTLHLDHITLTDEYIGLLAKCINLKNLSLSQCTTTGMNILTISHHRLSDLTLFKLASDYTIILEAVNVVAPQLKNLTIVHVYYTKLLISAPGLTSLVMKGNGLLKLCTDGFPSLEKMDLCIYNTILENVRKIVCVLQQFRSVKLLTLNLGIFKLLSSSKKLMSHQPCAFPKVKILNFTKSYPVMVCLEVKAQDKVTMSTDIKNHDSSSCDIFTMVSYEEIEVIKSIRSAKILMEELRGMLKSKNSNTNKAHIHEHGKTQPAKKWAYSTSELKGNFRKMMVDIEQGKIEGLLKKNSYLVSKLQQMISSLQGIEGLLTGLPASKRDVMQSSFSSLFKDVSILMNNVL